MSAGQRRRYRRRADAAAVTAIRLDLDTPGLEYTKWGHSQRANRGDWIVADDRGEVHTVAGDSFAATYAAVSPGRYVKTAPVWAERAAADGSVQTQEGRTAYRAGDWLVSNREDGGDAYAVPAARFEQLYEPD